MKNISQPTDTIMKEIVDFFKTTNRNYIATTWGSGCVVFIKKEINNEICFFIGRTDDWLGRLKQYSNIFNRETDLMKMFNFMGIRKDCFVHIYKNDEQVMELQASNFCKGIRKGMKDEDYTKMLMRQYKFNFQEGVE